MFGRCCRVCRGRGRLGRQGNYGKTDILELKKELQPGAVPKRSKVRPLNPD